MLNPSSSYANSDSLGPPQLAGLGLARRQVPDPAAPAASGLDLASSITGLVSNIIGLASTASSGSGEEDDEDPVSL